MYVAKNDEQPELKKRSYWKSFIKIQEMKLFWDMPSLVNDKIMINLIALQIKITMKKVLPMRRKLKQIYKKKILKHLRQSMLIKKRQNKVFHGNKHSKIWMMYSMRRTRMSYHSKKMFQTTVQTIDKKFHIRCTTKKAVNQLKKTTIQNVLKYACGPRPAAKRARTPLEAFSLFTNHEMLNTII